MSRENILFIGAHPDDIDLGCGISLHQHYLSGNQIVTLVLTEGERGGSPNRILEQNNSLNILAPGSRNKFLNFPDTRLFLYRLEIINEIRAITLEEHPDIVYLPTRHDFHQDHVVTNECALAVFNSLPVHKIITYESPSTMPQFSPNYFMLCDSDQFQIKLAALSCHQSQADKYYFSQDIIWSIAKSRGAQGRYHQGVAEAYEIIRWVEF